MTVSIPQRIWNGQPYLFAFCLFISFTRSFKKYNNMQYYSGSFVFLLETCQCITNNKNLITTFTFTFSVTHFNFTQLLFWILALLDLSFLLLLSDCSAFFYSLSPAHSPVFWAFHLSNSLLNPWNFLVHELSSLHALLFFSFLYTFIQPYSLFRLSCMQFPLHYSYIIFDFKSGKDWINPEMLYQSQTILGVLLLTRNLNIYQYMVTPSSLLIHKL